MRNTAIKALETMGPAAVPALTKALKDKKPDVRITIAQSLAKDWSGSHPKFTGNLPRQGI